ncbi:hypothetical protein K3495_g13378 [Podosphaera aphanis]|nr:hypothetical protein K3495_g13378 [Podosphaera aphanis]
MEGDFKDLKKILDRIEKYVKKAQVKELGQPARNQTSSVQSQVVKNEPITESVTQDNPDGEPIVTRTESGQEPVGVLKELVEKLAVTKPEPVCEQLITQTELGHEFVAIKALARIEKDREQYKIMVVVYFAEGDPRNVSKPLTENLYVSDSDLSRSHEFRRAELEAVRLAMEICRKDHFIIIYVEKEFIVTAMRCLHLWSENGWKSKENKKLEFENNYRILHQLKAEREKVGRGVIPLVDYSPGFCKY